MIKEITDAIEKEHIATHILLDLPDWFGMPTYTKDYIEKSKTMPFFASLEGDQVVGFIALHTTSLHTIEIFCMGVLKAYHKKGHGKALVDEVVTYSKRLGYKLMQVKTVKEGTYAIYDRTNQFYRAQGFYELEVFPTLWDAHNPCQIFVKPL